MNSDALPDLLQDLHALFLGLDDEVEFEPYDSFMDADERRDWFQAWTRNPEVDGAQFEIFGQDGSGGMGAFWRVRPDRPLLQQPIVFVGSEGELAVIASCFAAYLWLLAAGLGPCEACQVARGHEAPCEPIPAFQAFAERHAEGSRADPAEILERARQEFPGFASEIAALCG